jgi:hypothetical protein
MPFDRDWYEETAVLYTRFIRTRSQNCARQLNLIRSTYGALIGYHAAVAIMQMRVEFDRARKISDMEKYRRLLADYPEALPFFDLALQSFLRDQTPVTSEQTHDV